MRLSSSALALAAASSAAAVHDQKVLGGGQHNEQQVVLDKPDTEAWWNSLENLWGEATDEIKELWEEVSFVAPGALDDIVSLVAGNSKSTVPKVTRRPDSDWDFHLKGSEVGDEIVSLSGEKVKDDFDFGNYALRSRHVDPSKLGVDTVKQCSGYLDSFEQDKHLFFCEY
jgi:cathepsin A (carboxypeptidase C)